MTTLYGCKLDLHLRSLNKVSCGAMESKLPRRVYKLNNEQTCRKGGFWGTLDCFSPERTKK